MLFSKSSLPKMPPSDWKKKLTEKPSAEAKKERVKRIDAPKPKKPIPKISEKKKKRMKENGTEGELFRKVWDSRSNHCEICGIFIPEPKPECFSHILSKGRYPALRYNPKNIRLVCSAKCHSENDKRNAGNDIALLKEILG